MATQHDGGCTLTGALSVTAEIAGCITIIHGPAGCAHHNFSLFHALNTAKNRIPPPPFISSDMTERDVIFGGEHLLEETIRRALFKRPDLLCVLSTCVAATIGDDVDAVCHLPYDAPVVHIPTGGFLGGDFPAGQIQALQSLSGFAEGCEKTVTVNLVGEKTLEYEVDDHFREVSRILRRIGIPVNTRFVCASSLPEMRNLGRASLNILRDPSVTPVGESLGRTLGIPFIESFPLGIEGTLRFMERVGSHFSIDVAEAVAEEEALQKEMMRDFTSMKGMRVRFHTHPMTDVQSLYGYELAELLDLEIHDQGSPVPLPDPFPVGTNGIRRLLQRWRRSCHA